MLVKILVVVISIIIGTIIGILLTWYTYNCGNLVVDKSDPYDSTPYLFLELDKKNPDELLRKKYVMLKVTENLIRDNSNHFNED